MRLPSRFARRVAPESGAVWCSKAIRLEYRPDSFGVAAQATDPDYSEIGMDSPSAGVEENSTVELYLQGPMRIVSTAVPQGWWLKSATVGGVDAAEEPYSFAANGQPVAMTLVFADAASEVSGRVVDERGGAVRDAFLLAFSTNAARWQTRSQTSRAGVLTRTARFACLHCLQVTTGSSPSIASSRANCRTPRCSRRSRDQRSGSRCMNGSASSGI